MFRSPIAPTLRSAAHPPPPTIPRARIPMPFSQCPSRLFSTLRTRTQNAERFISPARTFPRPRYHIPSRPFSSARPRFFNGNYNRFSGRREPPWVLLLRNARPVHFVAVGGIIGGFYVYNTDTVEMTGRRRFNCVPYNQELKMGVESYNEVLRQYRGSIVPESHPVTLMVNRVLQRLIPLAPIDGADWKVHVIKDDNMMNAFVLPGGKVFVFTGILPICQDEDGLAAVLGHEIAHVVAHHTGERMSNSFVTMGVVLMAALLFDVSGNLPSMLLNLMYSLPNSRTQEAEADDIGLTMMAKACFNPEAAVGLWSRMQKAEKEAPPQFMSTHPSSYNRMETIRGWLDKAEAAYVENGCMGVGSYMPGFRQASGGDLW